MISNTVAYYHWPAVWVGDPPPFSDGTLDLKLLEKEEYRTTLTVGVKCKVLKEGLFIFDFSGWPQAQSPPDSDQWDFDSQANIVLKRVNVLNTYLACLYTTLNNLQKDGIGKMVVSPSGVISMESLNGSGMSFGDMRVAALSSARYPITYPQDQPPIFDWRLSNRSVAIKTETLKKSFDLLDTILQRQHSSPYLLLAIDHYARSCKSLEDHDYSLCLTTAWTISEKLLLELWERYIANNRERDGKSFINDKRKNKLEDHIKFPISVVTEILSLTNHLCPELYQEVEEIRKTRNKWVHEMEPVSRTEARKSLDVVEKMLSLVEQVELKVPTVSGLHFVVTQPNDGQTTH